VGVKECANNAEIYYFSNRIALLRLLTMVLSQPLYHSQEDFMSMLNPFATYFTNRRCKNSKTLFVSLLNSAISYDVGGYGIPYFSSVNKATELEIFTTLCYQALLILIEYTPPTETNI